MSDSITLYSGCLQDEGRASRVQSYETPQPFVEGVGGAGDVSRLAVCEASYIAQIDG